MDGLAKLPDSPAKVFRHALNLFRRLANRKQQKKTINNLKKLKIMGATPWMPIATIS